MGQDKEMRTVAETAFLRMCRSQESSMLIAYLSYQAAGGQKLPSSKTNFVVLVRHPGMRMSGLRIHKTRKHSLEM